MKGKTVLVTGAGGSIGSELCREILKEKPRKLVMFDNSELALYNIERELRAPNVEAVLGDITNDVELDIVFCLAGTSVDVVFHAAAYKHVTLCERNRVAAFRVNVDGTRMLCKYAQTWAVKTFITVSTDKAVNPTCVMGRTKRHAENITRDYGYTVVRLGNVVGSSGSVIPLWKEQIARGQPVTITHRDATRYFITATDAAVAIIEAAELQPGTYVPEMGSPVKIVDVARDYGATQFEEIGLRPGEKLHEELFVGERGCTAINGLWEDAA